MGLEKVEIKIFSPVVKNFVQKTGVRSVLQTKTPIFHGINPTLTYLPSSNSFALPRFCSEEMQLARKMNKIAIRQAKAGEVVRTYPKATPQDLKRLTSETIEDSYSRVEWTNPNDGKVYNLLKQGETEDGKVIVRILDEEGAFIKEAEIVPKDIAIIDDFAANIVYTDAANFSHGDLVKIYAQRNNPFANYKLINVNDKEQFVLLHTYFKESFLRITDKIKGRHFDYINISLADEHSIPLRLEELEPQIRKALTSLNGHTKNGTRILMGSGNMGKDYINSYIKEQIEGVGAISPNGKISQFSASRNSKYTQHYEVGEYEEKLVYNNKGEIIGLNITGKPGCDYKFKVKVRTDEQIQRLKDLKQQKAVLEAQIDGVNREIEHSYNLSRSIMDLCSKDLEKYKKFSELRKKLYEILDEIKNITNETKCYRKGEIIVGTSLSTPTRTAKLALNDMMEGIL